MKRWLWLFLGDFASFLRSIVLFDIILIYLLCWVNFYRRKNSLNSFTIKTEEIYTMRNVCHFFVICNKNNVKTYSVFFYDKIFSLKFEYTPGFPLSIFYRVWKLRCMHFVFCIASFMHFDYVHHFGFVYSFHSFVFILSYAISTYS